MRASSAKSILSGFALGTIALSAIACGPSGTSAEDADAQGVSPGADGGTTTGPVTNECPNGTMTTVTGRVTAPNGIDPVPNAIVYVPRSLQDFPSGASCELCSNAAGDAYVQVVTAADGSFELGPIPTTADQAPGQTVTVVSQKGRFRRVAEVTINNVCGENSGNDAAYVLPSANEGQNTVPKIAVARGEYDKMECVLRKIGLKDSALTVIDGKGSGVLGLGESDFSKQLLKNRAALLEHNIVFINCGQYEDSLDDEAVKSNLEAYVAAGGRLYVTDQAYDFVEQVTDFSKRIDFAPQTGDSSSGPERHQAAQIGKEGDRNGTIVNDDLAEWLQAVETVTNESVFSGPQVVRLKHFLPGWAQMLGVDTADDTNLWVTTDDDKDGTIPLSITFDHNSCGRVLYTSYHTEGCGFVDCQFLSFPAYCDDGPLTPQERILEYLILHVADCIPDID